MVRKNGPVKKLPVIYSMESPRTPSKFVSVRPDSPIRRTFSPTKAPKYDLTPDNHIEFHRYRRTTPTRQEDLTPENLDREILQGIDLTDSLKVLARDTTPANFGASPPLEEKSASSRDKLIQATSWDNLIKAVPSSKKTLTERFSPKK